MSLDPPPEHVIVSRIEIGEWLVIVLCFLNRLSGKSPFHGESDEETISKIQYLRFRISSVHPNSSESAHKFIYHCLKRVPR